MKKLFPLISILAILSVWLIGNTYAITLVNENFDGRTFSSAINVITNDNYCTGVGCTYGTISNNTTGYSLQGSHDVSSYNLTIYTAEDPIVYMNAGLYIRYYVYFPSSYQFVAECGSSYNNHKILKFAGSVGGTPDIEIHWADAVGGLAGNANQMGKVKIQYTKEDNSTFGLNWYNIPSGHWVEKDKWNKIEIYLKNPASGSSNSTIHLSVNGATVFNLTNIPVNKGSYSGTKQIVSVRSPSSSCMPSSGHGTWYSDDLKIVYGEGDLTGSDVAAPSPPTGLKIVN